MNYNFLIICRYLNIVNNQSSILEQIENSQVITSLRFWTDYYGKNMLFLVNFTYFKCLQVTTMCKKQNLHTQVFTKNKPVKSTDHVSGLSDATSMEV
jgi:hypothetical protein